eukprot:TRINITY_DN8250_c0_g1_i2.p2 TRINITY_DN8250_c0_g1~~TRINITY_DN8250_c0_g1_i2.p2  ORF type:complete len:101 (+),score=0.45 TRINITY_DN8250_c0_g1_i2:2-304(+)
MCWVPLDSSQRMLLRLDEGYLRPLRWVRVVPLGLHSLVACLAAVETQVACFARIAFLLVGFARFFSVCARAATLLLGYVPTACIGQLSALPLVRQMHQLP